jgi:Ca-activated chloride channel family protein
MIGFRFDFNDKNKEDKTIFEKLLDIFKELLIHTSGDVTEALSWLTEIDKKYKITNEDYGMADFIKDLIDKGYIENKERRGQPGFNPTSKMETQLRKHALDDIFDQVRKSKSGQHNTKLTGQGDESTSEIKPYEFGDKLDGIAMTETIKNAHINHGIEEFAIGQEDIAVYEKYQQSQTSTVLMIDISHSMILYGEDRITPAKKVAMALSELIITKYPKDTLDIIVFGDDAWEVEIKDLPYLQVGPYHTNTVAGIELAMDILKRRKNPNKQIMMITDGKPTCIKKGKKYYKNSMGLDRTIFTRTMSLAVKCKKMNVPITTFMIARDPYLIHFVDKFTAANGGKAFYSNLQGLGEFIFMDYKNSKRKKR